MTTIQKVMLLGAGGLFGSEIFTALQNEPSFIVSVLTRTSSTSTFPSNIKVHKIGDDYPHAELIAAFTGQDALVSALPGRPFTIHIRMIDAAIEAGVKRFIPSEYGNNTCTAAADLVPLYAEKAKVIAHLKSKESTGLTWTAIHTGQFFDWGLKSGWLDYHLAEKRANIYDSGEKVWSTTTIGTASIAVTKVLLKPTETKNRAVHVALFTLSQRQLLTELQKAATGDTWRIESISSEEALKKAMALDHQDKSEGLKLQILMLLYAEDANRGAGFQNDGKLDNALLGLPAEDLAEAVERVVREHRLGQ